MIEEEAQVVEVDDGGVWVETQRRSTCSGCSARSGCGTAALASVLGRRRSRVHALAEPGLRPGDRVVIGIREQALVRGSLAVYTVPLLGLLAGALAGEYIAGLGLVENAEAASIFLGLSGLGAGLAWLRRFTRRIRNDRRYQPVVLRRAGVATTL